MKKLILTLCAIVCAICLSAADKTYTVVIDPGHGGKDPGAIGAISKEKDLNLTLALKVGKMIDEQYPDVKVVYTRDKDVFIPLQIRADIANKKNADLFISIHANASDSKAAHGVETFILGTEKMEKNLDVAMRENAVMKLESDYKTTYQGFDPNSIDSYIMFELMQNSYMDQSLRFATLVQNKFVGHLNRGDRGVRQAAFWVLLKTACPSILFEMGFISNPEEEAFLNQDSTMTRMAQALVDAFGAYTARTPQIEKVAVKEQAQTVKEKAPKQKEKTATAKEKEKENQSTLKIETVRHDSVKTATTPLTAKPEMREEPQVVRYAVQICATKTFLQPNDPKLKGLECQYTKIGDWYKYYTAVSETREAAAAKQKELKALFPDCWIITINNN